MTVIIFLIILAFLIFIHEFGHFLFAKLSGAGVEEFCIGFPPRAYSKKIGETIYSIGILPIGGFVKIVGEDGDPNPSSTNEAQMKPAEHNLKEVEKEQTLNPETKETKKWAPEKFLSNKPRYIQALVMVGGVLFNFLGAWVLISAGSLSGLPTEISESKYAEYISNPKPFIVVVAPDSPADLAKIEAGSEIIGVKNNKETLNILNSSTITNFIQNTSGPITFSLSNQKKETTEISLEPKEIDGIRKIGIGLSDIGNLKLPIYLAPIVGAEITWQMTKDTTSGLFLIVKESLMGNTDILKNISGPVGIAKMVGTAKEMGLAALIIFTAIISVNLTIINLIPLPALDGGRLLIIALEGTIRRKLNPKIVGAINGFGLIFLLILMAIITFQDILNLS